MDIETALQTLGLTTEATAEDVKEAYRDLVKIWHPDRFQGDARLNAKTEAQIKTINEAKKVALAYQKKYGHFRFVGRQKRHDQARQYRQQSYETGGAAGQSAQQQQSQQRARKQNQSKRTYQDQQQQQQQKQEQQRTQSQQRKKSEPKQSRPKAAPQADIFESSESRMGQYTLVGVFILAVVISFVVMLVTSLNDRPEDRVKSIRQQQDTSMEELKRRLKEERYGKSEPNTESTAAATPPAVKAKVDTFFTLGSNKEWVSYVQGPPTQIKGPIWHYGLSTIEFKGDSVIGWDSAEDSPLLIGMLQGDNPEYEDKYFTVGSLKRDVLAVQGAPTRLEETEWGYGDAYIQFNGDTVKYFKNDRVNSLRAVW